MKKNMTSLRVIQVSKEHLLFCAYADVSFSLQLLWVKLMTTQKKKGKTTMTATRMRKMKVRVSSTAKKLTY